MPTRWLTKMATVTIQIESGGHNNLRFQIPFLNFASKKQSWIIPLFIAADHKPYATEISFTFSSVYFFAIFCFMFVNAHVKHSAHVCAFLIGLRKAAESRTLKHLCAPSHFESKAANELGNVFCFNSEGFVQDTCGVRWAQF